MIIKGFWDKLNKPIMVLAPMADVTDSAFRRIIAKYSKWDGKDIFDNEGNIRKKYIKGGKFT
ncbi:MAG: hypothetical protein HQ402_03970, partial [Parcubacteria group bacterium]|nr:hypothetical protein [Parcubacteria group bacterium]